MALPKPTPDGTPLVPSNGASMDPLPAGVFPIRGTTPPEPLRAVEPILLASARLATQRVPVAQRPWRVLLVPPTPGAPTRAFEVARWHARVALAALVILVLVAGGALAAVGVALRSPDLFATGAEVWSLRDRLAAVEDSLSIARLALAEGDVEGGDSSVAVVAAPNAVGRAMPGTKQVPTLATRLAVRSGVAASRVDGSATRTLLRIAELPVIGTIVSGFSRARKHPLLHIVRPHLGVDVSAPAGTPISAPASGRVLFVGRKFSYGLTVEIEHSNGVITRYGHLRAADVTEGESVARGARIGSVGSSGLTTGPHLHYEMIVNGRPVDPLRYRMPQVGDSSTLAGQRPGQPGASISGPTSTHDETVVPLVTPLAPPPR